MSAIASILVGHVNKVSHKNPHGITLPDLGLTISYDFVANTATSSLPWEPTCS